MKSRQSTILAFGFTLLLSTTSTLQPAVTFAAPVSTPSPASSVPPTKSSVPLASEDCRRCLALELICIPKCDSLFVSTPALLPSERDPVRIQEYKTKFPAVVDCLCKAASLAKGSEGWIKKCDAFCTVAVEKNQKRILNTFSEQLSCDSDAGPTSTVSSVSSSSSSSDSSLSNPAVKTGAKSLPNAAGSSPSHQPLSSVPAKVAPAVAAVSPASIRPSMASTTHTVPPAQLRDSQAT